MEEGRSPTEGLGSVPATACGCWDLWNVHLGSTIDTFTRLTWDHTEDDSACLLAFLINGFVANEI